MIEGDGLFVFLQGPQETGVFLLYGVFQKLCADAAALEDRLHEELFDFTISGMPVASSQYWNSFHGGAPGEAVRDEEGLPTMRTLARNMAFLMNANALGKEKYGLPVREKGIATNFIR